MHVTTWETTVFSFASQIWHPSYPNEFSLVKNNCESSMSSMLFKPAYNQPHFNWFPYCSWSGRIHLSPTGFCSWDTELYYPIMYKLYADLPGHLASTSPLSTVPPSLSSFSGRPDIALVSSDYIILLELSFVTNREEHFATASSRKVTRYCPLLSDLECSVLLTWLQLKLDA